MALVDDIADRLAREALALSQELGDDRLTDELAQIIGATSPTTEEAFRTALRLRIAEARADKFLAQKRGSAKT